MDFSSLRETVAEGWKSSMEALQNPRALTEHFQDLSQVKKMELGAAGFVFLVASCYLAWNWSYWGGTAVESDIRVSGAKASVARDSTQPVSATNPKVARSVTVFSGPAGRVEIVQKAAEQGIQFTPAADAKWSDAWALWSGTSDGARRMILLAAIGIGEQRGWRLSSAAKLSAEQSKSEEALRRELQENMNELEQGAMDGSFESAAADKVIRAVEQYRMADGDARQKAAAQVMALGTTYGQHIELARQKAISAYADAVDKLLEPAQRAALKQAAASFALPSGTTVAS